MDAKFQKTMVAAMSIIIVVFISYIAFSVMQGGKASFGIVAILILAGLGAFIGLMNFLSLTSQWLGMIDPRQPFGLPEGTVRAILTIAFIVLVGVFGSYLLTESGGREPFVAEPISVQSGISQAEAQASVGRLSADGLAIIVPNAKDSTKFDVLLRPRKDYRLADDVAKQILTMLSTILAAMIGFYFGTRPGDANASRTDAAERASLLADLNRRALTEPTVTSIRAAADIKGADPAKKDAVAKIKTTLEETEKKITAARIAIGDLSQPIEKVRSACVDATAAIDKLADLNKTAQGL